MLAYMFFPVMALLIGVHTLRVADRRGRLAKLYGATLVVIALAMAGGLISAEIARAAPHNAVALLH